MFQGNNMCLLFRTLCSAFPVPRPASATAQGPPAYPGTSTTLNSTYRAKAGDGEAVGTWAIGGPDVSVTGPSLGLEMPSLRAGVSA